MVSNNINIIYKIKNKINGKIYIGQTWRNIAERVNEHCKKSGKNILNKAIKKYKRENFDIEILTFCSTQEIADHWEMYFITKYNTIIFGYNLTLGGSRGKHSESTKRKISKANKGQVRTEEQIKKMSIVSSGERNGNFGKKHTDEAKAKISAKNAGNTYCLGRAVTQKVRDTNSKLKKGNTYALGNKHTDEAKAKMSERQMGKFLTEETKAKIAATKAKNKIAKDNK